MTTNHAWVLKLQELCQIADVPQGMPFEESIQRVIDRVRRDGAELRYAENELRSVRRALDFERVVREQAEQHNRMLMKQMADGVAMRPPAPMVVDTQMLARVKELGAQLAAARAELEELKAPDRILPSGTVVHLGGIPQKLMHDAVVKGYAPNADANRVGQCQVVGAGVDLGAQQQQQWPASRPNSLRRGS